MNIARAAACLPFLLLLFILPFPGTVALRLACLAASFVVAMALWRRNEVPPIPCKLPIAFWILVAFGSIAYAVDPAYSLGEIKNEIGYAMLAFLAFFVVTRGEMELKAWILALASGIVVLCSWILALRLATGGWNEGAGHGGTGAFAAYAVTVLPAVLLGTAIFQKRPQQLAIAGVAGLLLVTAFFSQQRIIWLTLCLEAFVALWLLRRSGVVQLSTRRAAALFFAVAVLAGVGFAGTQVVRFHDGGTGLATGEGRLTQWPKVIARIAEHPVSGSGFGRMAMKKEHRDLIPRENTLLWHAHNLPLNYGLSMGLPGIVAILGVFLGLLLEYWKFLRVPDRRVRLLGIAGIAMVLGVLLRNQVNDLFLRDLAILFWALNGALLGFGERLKARAAT